MGGATRVLGSTVLGTSGKRENPKSSTRFRLGLWITGEGPKVEKTECGVGGTSTSSGDVKD